MLAILNIAVSYILGSIPFGLIVGKLFNNIDIRNYGSGNIGATNVARVIGKKWGVVVFFLDLIKGFIPIIIAIYFGLAQDDKWMIIFTGLAAVCGHNWSIFLKFRGGKGVSTSLGVILGYGLDEPMLLGAVAVSFLLWGLVFKLSKIVSISSLISAVCFLVLALFMPISREYKILAVILFIFIAIRHRSNIKRLITKKENKF